jgi:hypothetical protein
VEHRGPRPPDVVRRRPRPHPALHAFAADLPALPALMIRPDRTPVCTASQGARARPASRRGSGRGHPALHHVLRCGECVRARGRRRSTPGTDPGCGPPTPRRCLAAPRERRVPASFGSLRPACRRRGDQPAGGRGSCGRPRLRRFPYPLGAKRWSGARVGRIPPATSRDIPCRSRGARPQDDDPVWTGPEMREHVDRKNRAARQARGRSGRSRKSRDSRSPASSSGAADGPPRTSFHRTTPDPGSRDRAARRLPLLFHVEHRPPTCRPHD